MSSRPISGSISTLWQCEIRTKLHKFGSLGLSVSSTQMIGWACFGRFPWKSSKTHFESYRISIEICPLFNLPFVVKTVLISMVSNGDSVSGLDVARFRRTRTWRWKGGTHVHFTFASFSVCLVNFSDASFHQNASFLSLVYCNFECEFGFWGCILKSEFNFVP